MKILTVSIAAYNVEKYLEQTLSSLCDERVLEDIEVLVIDDGSKDGTASIAEHYMKEYPNTVHYVKKENGGHGSTINKGMELATGKYFKVIDGDDWVDTEEFVKFVDALKNTDTDIVLTSFWKVSPKGKSIVQFSELEVGKVFSLLDDKKTRRTRITLHSLTVKTSLLKEANVRITEHCFYVDIEFVVWAIYLSESLLYLQYPIYMYRIGNENQSVAKKNMLRNVNMQKTVSINLAKMYKKFLDESLNDNKLQYIYVRIKRSISATIRTYMLMDNAKDTKKEIVNFERDIRLTCPKLFAQMNNDNFICSLRWNNYSLIALIRLIYKTWLNTKG